MVQLIKHSIPLLTALSIMVFTGSISLAHAQEKPLWELGAGVSYIRLPDYRGAGQSRNYVLPYPYAVYRGGFLRVEDNGISGRLFTSDRVTLDTSLYGSVPVRSKDNDAREGMPDLDPTFEMGPAIKIKLFTSDDRALKTTLTFPLRFVFSTDFTSVRYQGMVFSPRLNLDKEDLIPGTGVDLWVSAGPIFADRKYHDYFYEVDPKYATPVRPAYSAGSGYSGSSVLVSFGKKMEPFIFHIFVSADFLRGSIIEDSPLVRKKTSLMAGCSLSWVFMTSKEMVIRDN
jgi:outer membrane scaffolding protein for murein synthesis (MipA/OmpV family)